MKKFKNILLTLTSITIGATTIIASSCNNTNKESKQIDKENEDILAKKLEEEKLKNLNLSVELKHDGTKENTLPSSLKKENVIIKGNNIDDFNIIFVDLSSNDNEGSIRISYKVVSKKYPDLFILKDTERTGYKILPKESQKEAVEKINKLSDLTQKQKEDQISKIKRLQGDKSISQQVNIAIELNKVTKELKDKLQEAKNAREDANYKLADLENKNKLDNAILLADGAIKAQLEAKSKEDIQELISHIEASLSNLNGVKNLNIEKINKLSDLTQKQKEDQISKINMLQGDEYISQQVNIAIELNKVTKELKDKLQEAKNAREDANYKLADLENKNKLDNAILLADEAIKAQLEAKSKEDIQELKENIQKALNSLKDEIDKIKISKKKKELQEKLSDTRISVELERTIKNNISDYPASNIRKEDIVISGFDSNLFEVEVSKLAADDIKMKLSVTFIIKSKEYPEISLKADKSFTGFRNLNIDEDETRRILNNSLITIGISNEINRNKTLASNITKNNINISGFIKGLFNYQIRRISSDDVNGILTVEYKITSKNYPNLFIEKTASLEDFFKLPISKELNKVVLSEAEEYVYDSTLSSHNNIEFIGDKSSLLASNVTIEQINIKHPEDVVISNIQLFPENYYGVLTITYDAAIKNNETFKTKNKRILTGFRIIRPREEQPEEQSKNQVVDKLQKTFLKFEVTENKIPSSIVPSDINVSNYDNQLFEYEIEDLYPMDDFNLLIVSYKLSSKKYPGIVSDKKTFINIDYGVKHIPNNNALNQFEISNVELDDLIQSYLWYMNWDKKDKDEYDHLNGKLSSSIIVDKCNELLNDIANYYLSNQLSHRNLTAIKVYIDYISQLHGEIYNIWQMEIQKLKDNIWNIINFINGSSVLEHIPSELTNKFDALSNLTSKKTLPEYYKELKNLELEIKNFNHKANPNLEKYQRILDEFDKDFKQLYEGRPLPSYVGWYILDFANKNELTENNLKKIKDNIEYYEKFDDYYHGLNNSVTDGPKYRDFQIKEILRMLDFVTVKHWNDTGQIYYKKANEIISKLLIENIDNHEIEKLKHEALELSKDYWNRLYNLDNLDFAKVWAEYLLDIINKYKENYKGPKSDIEDWINKIKIMKNHPAWNESYVISNGSIYTPSFEKFINKLDPNNHNTDDSTEISSNISDASNNDSDFIKAINRDVADQFIKMIEKNNLGNLKYFNDIAERLKNNMESELRNISFLIGEAWDTIGTDIIFDKNYVETKLMPEIQKNIYTFKSFIKSNEMNMNPINKYKMTNYIENKESEIQGYASNPPFLIYQYNWTNMDICNEWNRLVEDLYFNKKLVISSENKKKNNIYELFKYTNVINSITSDVEYANLLPSQAKAKGIKFYNYNKELFDVNLIEVTADDASGKLNLKYELISKDFNDIKYTYDITYTLKKTTE
ncbi:coiled-coil domain-containing protein [Mycoplasma sp. VS276A1]